MPLRRVAMLEVNLFDFSSEFFLLFGTGCPDASTMETNPV
jgi:hypothetical protein